MLSSFTISSKTICHRLSMYGLVWKHGQIIILCMTLVKVGTNIKGVSATEKLFWSKNSQWAIKNEQFWEIGLFTWPWGFVKESQKNMEPEFSQLTHCWSDSKMSPIWRTVKTHNTRTHLGGQGRVHTSSSTLLFWTALERIQHPLRIEKQRQA